MFGVLAVVLFKQLVQVLAAMCDTSYLNPVIFWEVKDDVSGVGDGVTTHFGDEIISGDTHVRVFGQNLEALAQMDNLSAGNFLSRQAVMIVPNSIQVPYDRTSNSIRGHQSAADLRDAQRSRPRRFMSSKNS